MRKALRALCTLATLVALAGASVAEASSGGITGQSGLGGGSYCSACHTIGATPTPAVSFSGPTELLEGVTGDFVFTVTRGTTSHSHAGFNVAATGGTLSTNQAGTRLANGELTHQSPLAYSGESASFAFRWTAPAEGTYTLGGAGNSVDRDGSNSGDASSTATWTVEVLCEETVWYRDFDGDGYGNPDDWVLACDQPDGYVDNDLDCDDSDPEVFPGATEICDGKDNNCSGFIDDDDPDLVGAPTWYRDADGDGFGDPDDSVVACAAPTGYVDNDLDCDDSDPAIHPDAVEICDGRDNSCTGVVDGDDEGLLDCMCTIGETQACYTGPSGTEGVGLCAAGEQTCSDGTWGACEDQVTPALEDDCGTPFDETCSGVVNEGCEGDPNGGDPDPNGGDPGSDPDDPAGCDCVAGSGASGLAFLVLAGLSVVLRPRRRPRH